MYFIITVKSIDNYCMKIVDKVVVNSDELNEYIKLNRNIKSNNITTIYHFSTNPVVSKPPTGYGWNTSYMLTWSASSKGVTKMSDKE